MKTSNRIENLLDSDLTLALGHVHITVEIKKVRGHGAARFLTVRHHGRLVNMLSGLVQNTAAQVSAFRARVFLAPQLS